MKEDIRTKPQMWEVTVNSNTGGAMAFPCISDSSRSGEYVMKVRSFFGSRYVDFCVSADTSERAKNIAYERYFAVKANGWRYPLLFFRCVRDHHGRHYPRYDFQTGEILLKEGETLELPNSNNNKCIKVNRL